MYQPSLSPPMAAPSGGVFSTLRRVERWLDDRGRGAWIAAMVLGFVFVWPLGLFLLGYMIWSKRMFSRSGCGHRRDKMRRHAHVAFSTSGNSAFDAYKSDTLRRLEEEQEAFSAFLQRLREAKDKSEFDTFMDDRARAAANRPADTPNADSPTGGY